MKKTTLKRFLVLAGVLLLGGGVSLFPLPSAQAATLDEVIQQIDTYKASGDIKDASLADALHHMVYDAAYRSTDQAAKDDILEAFKDTVTANSGDLITSAAASQLLGMVP